MDYKKTARCIDREVVLRGIYDIPLSYRLFPIGYDIKLKLLSSMKIHDELDLSDREPFMSVIWEGCTDELGEYS